jgi:hypothetical protein
MPPRCTRSSWIAPEQGELASVSGTANHTPLLLPPDLAYRGKLFKLLMCGPSHSITHAKRVMVGVDRRLVHGEMLTLTGIEPANSH